MDKTQNGGVKRLTVNLIPCSCRIQDHLREDGRYTSYARGFDAYVRLQLQLEKTVIPEPFHYGKMSHRMFAVPVRDSIQFTILRVAADRSVNGPLIMTDVAVHQGQVTAVHAVILQLGGKRSMSFIILRAIIRPVVSLSIRWTMPGRSSPLMPDKSLQ